MKRFAVSLVLGIVLAIAIYLCVAAVWFNQLAALQYPRVPLQEATSFPPSYAFFAALPYPLISLIPGTLLAWLGLIFFNRKLK
jgi:Mg/Co/Ni transporter MgtE